MHQIILASQSPRRKQLLEWAQLKFEIITSNTLELIPPNTNVYDVPEIIAAEKAEVVYNSIKDKYSNPIVIAADTVVVLNNTILGKPENEKQAMEMLAALSGNQHTVVTGVVIISNQKTVKFSDSTQVHFHPITTADIEYYVSNYKPYDKAGAYAIQEWIGVTGIKKIDGDFYNVMGLPVSRVLQALSNF
jgi:septum formation protein